MRKSRHLLIGFALRPLVDKYTEVLRQALDSAQVYLSWRVLSKFKWSGLRARMPNGGWSGNGGSHAIGLCGFRSRVVDRSTFKSERSREFHNIQVV